MYTTVIPSENVDLFCDPGMFWNFDYEGMDLEHMKKSTVSLSARYFKNKNNPLFSEFSRFGADENYFTGDATAFWYHPDPEAPGTNYLLTSTYNMIC